MKKQIHLLFWLILILPIFCFGSSKIMPTAAIKSLISTDIQKLLWQHGYKEVLLRASKDKKFFFIDISFGDKQSKLPFIIDTGSIETSIDQQIETKYQFKKYGKNFKSGGGGGNYFVTYQVMIPEMQMGTYKINHELATIQHYSHILVDKKHIGGMIGLDFLRKYHAILDIKNHRLFLQVDSQKAAETHKLIQDILIKNKYECIQLNRSSLGYQTLPVKVNNAAPVQFMLDSGVDPAVMIDYQYAKKISLPLKGNPSIGHGSSNGVMKIYQADVDSLTIGKSQSGFQPAIVTTGLEFAKIGIPIFGIIGLTWMRSHQAIIDTSNDLFFYRPS